MTIREWDEELRDVFESETSEIQNLNAKNMEILDKKLSGILMFPVIWCAVFGS